MLTTSSVQAPTLAPDLLLDTYFARIHGKPYHVLDEATTRQRLQANQLPSYLAFAIYAVSARYEPTLQSRTLRLTLPGMHLISAATMPQSASAQSTRDGHEWSLTLTSPQLRLCKH